MPGCCTKVGWWTSRVSQSWSQLINSHHLFRSVSRQSSSHMGKALQFSGPPSTDQESAQGTCMPIAGSGGESPEPIPFRASLSNRTFGLSNKISQIRNSRKEIRDSLALKVTRKGVSKVYLNVKAIKRKRRAMARKVASRRQRMRWVEILGGLILFFL